jgi:hypothetical protein
MKKFISPVLLSLSLIFISAAPKNGVQLFPTNLRITVLDDLGNLQEGATVIIYENEENYREEVNPVAGPDQTDRKGRVTFKKIPAKSYFVQVVKGDKKNDGKGVKTAKLDEGRMNKINVVIN